MLEPWHLPIVLMSGGLSPAHGKASKPLGASGERYHTVVARSSRRLFAASLTKLGQGELAGSCRVQAMRTVASCGFAVDSKISGLQTGLFASFRKPFLWAGIAMHASRLHGSP